jgi:ribosome modulation factor
MYMEKMRESDKEKIGMAGYEACRAGMDCEFGARKYPHDDEKEERRLWLDGWNTARADMDLEGKP